ncbi:MAG: hypothetical protein JNM51_11750 [Bacteroidia bacterium]|nr:hypothetical protein [Bacteroidia bacterium]
MKSLLSLTILSIVISFYSCKKDKKVEPVEELVNTSGTTYPNYSNLKVGNYWIYQRFEIDTLGNATPLAIIDSCYIEKDTVIRGNTYYKYTGPEFHSLMSPTAPSTVRSMFLRDSLSYLITSYGDILFSSQDFTTVFDSGYIITPPNDTVCKFVLKMNDYNMNIITPSGTYVTSNFQTSYNFYHNYIIYGETRYKNVRYAENIGMVTQDWGFFLANPNYWQRQLIRYQFN